MITYVAFDNGVSGTVGWSAGDGSCGIIETPVKRCLGYQRVAKNMHRIDVDSLEDFLRPFAGMGPENPTRVVLERPMVNNARFQATLSAVRALEATLIVLERLRLPYEYVDSKKWQSYMLPSGLKGAPALKKASADIGCRLFPQFADLIKKHGDADGLLMAEWARRTNL